MHLDFRGKLAVVTGGANGIGLAAARALAGGGASVWIFDLERERPEETARSLGGQACCVDVTDRASIDAAFERSDICAVAAASVVGEAMVAVALCDAALEKFGGDSLGELVRNVQGYRAQLAGY